MSESGTQSMLGYETHRAGDEVTITLRIEEKHLNRSGLLHGGIAATVLDAVSGYKAERAMGLGPEARVVTVSLTTNYLQAGRHGDLLTASASAVGKGKTIQHVTAELRRQDGALVATANGIFKRIRMRRR